MSRPLWIILPSLVIGVVLVGFLFRSKSIPNSQPASTGVPEDRAEAIQLNVGEFPEVTLSFSSDSHFVTVDIKNIRSAQIEYNLIYDAVVKGNKIQTGVNASARLDGKTEYSQKQLLGSESNKKFTYHQSINNALLELTLRDDSGRSVYSEVYPFEVTPGKSQILTPNL